MNLFVQFNQVGVTVLIASHDLGLISQMNRRQLLLHEGRLVEDRPAGIMADAHVGR